MEDAHITYRSTDNSWSSLTHYPLQSGVSYFLDENKTATFQVSLTQTPKSSPETNQAAEYGKEEFASSINTLASKNPFCDMIPDVYPDSTLNHLTEFIEGNFGAEDPKVIALLLAMPGSGKTRTVLEASKEAKNRGRVVIRKKFKMCAYTGGKRPFNRTGEALLYLARSWCPMKMVTRIGVHHLPCRCRLALKSRLLRLESTLHAVFSELSGLCYS